MDIHTRIKPGYDAMIAAKDVDEESDYTDILNQATTGFRQYAALIMVSFKGLVIVLPDLDLKAIEENYKQVLSKPIPDLTACENFIIGVLQAFNQSQLKDWMVTAQQLYSGGME